MGYYQWVYRVCLRVGLEFRVCLRVGLEFGKSISIIMCVGVHRLCMTTTNQQVRALAGWMELEEPTSTNECFSACVLIGQTTKQVISIIYRHYTKDSTPYKACTCRHSHTTQLVVVYTANEKFYPPTSWILNLKTIIKVDSIHQHLRHNNLHGTARQYFQEWGIPLVLAHIQRTLRGNLPLKYILNH